MQHRDVPRLHPHRVAGKAPRCARVPERRRCVCACVRAQGLYTLAALAQHGSSVLLWDSRRSRVSVAELSAPHRSSLAGGLQASRDGHLLYAINTSCQVRPLGCPCEGTSSPQTCACNECARGRCERDCAAGAEGKVAGAQGGQRSSAASGGSGVTRMCRCAQLLVWDLRQGTASSGVLQFGGTGLYQHPLLLQRDLSGLLQAAWREQQQQQQQARQGGGGGGGGAALQDDGGAAPWRPVVDSLLLDPDNPSRLALVMQVRTRATRWAPAHPAAGAPRVPRCELVAGWRAAAVPPRAQDCSAAVLQLPSCSVSHLWVSRASWESDPLLAPGAAAATAAPSTAAGTQDGPPPPFTAATVDPHWARDL